MSAGLSSGSFFDVGLKLVGELLDFALFQTRTTLLDEVGDVFAGFAARLGCEKKGGCCAYECASKGCGY
jgi:hypothetical protein